MFLELGWDEPNRVLENIGGLLGSAGLPSTSIVYFRVPVLTAGFTSVIEGAGALERITAQASRPSKASATAQTTTKAEPVAPEYCTTIGAMITETRFTTLIIGLSAGPAVSLNGSPTVSPTTPALCRSEPFPVLFATLFGSSSINFLALSHAPPELFRNTASN